MKRFTLFQWAAVLTLALALTPLSASAQEDDTVTISGVFSMDYDFDSYYLDPRLWSAYVNGYEHTWTLTLHGAYQSHSSWVDLENATYANITRIRAASFDLEFFGPDAAKLNGFVNDNLAGGAVDISLQNTYSFDGGGSAILQVAVFGNSGMHFYSGHDTFGGNGTGVDTLFPTDADGYPVVQSEPFSIQPDITELGFFDLLSGWYAALGSLAGPVSIAGSVGQSPPPLPTLSIQDGSVREGKRGTTSLNLTVTLSTSSTSTVTVNYATADGTAIAGSDYISAIGTLTFQPGQTSKTVSISVKGDRKKESDETLYVDLFEPDGATIADGTATATILNDD